MTPIERFARALQETAMTPIDTEIQKLLNHLGGGWFLEIVESQTLTADTFDGNGSRQYLPGGYRARIRHPAGLTSEGFGETIGNAIDHAAAEVLNQELRGARCRNRG